MNNRTDHGFLVLADVSGFTAFVTTTELEHGSEIIAALLDEVTEHLAPALQRPGTEGAGGRGRRARLAGPLGSRGRGGEGVFALGGEAARLPRSRLLQVLEDAFVAFKTRQRAPPRGGGSGGGRGGGEGGSGG